MTLVKSRGQAPANRNRAGNPLVPALTSRGRGLLILVLLAFSARCVRAIEPAPEVNVAIHRNPGARALSPLLLGLSYETREVLPQEGRYYFDPNDEKLVRLFRTLGVKSLRIGGNAVDDPRVPVPREKDIDSLFQFARRADVKVIYSFRLKNGDPSLAARLASYISTHYKDSLDCFCIGNEPDKYLKTYREFLAAFEPNYAAILKAAPSATFEEPAGADWTYALEFAYDYYPRGHLKAVSAHSYPLGSGRAAERNTAESLKRFLGDDSLKESEKFDRDTCAPLAARGIPYRMDEANSCWDGGAKGSSDSFASALWGFDYLNWWAARQIEGVNFHTGDTVNGNPPMTANYAAFTHRENRDGFLVRPLALGMLAFSQVAGGTPLTAHVRESAAPELIAYAYAKEATVSVALINRSYGAGARALTVSVALPSPSASGTWERMDLTQRNADVSARNSIDLGGAGLEADGTWKGRWQRFEGTGSGAAVTVQPASVVLLRFTTLPQSK